MVKVIMSETEKQILIIIGILCFVLIILFLLHYTDLIHNHNILVGYTERCVERYGEYAIR